MLEERYQRKVICPNCKEPFFPEEGNIRGILFLYCSLLAFALFWQEYPEKLEEAIHNSIVRLTVVELMAFLFLTKGGIGGSIIFGLIFLFIDLVFGFVLYSYFS